MCLQCFDAVGWVSGSHEVLVWLSVWSEVQIVCIWSSWCHCIPKPHHLLPRFKSRLVLPFWYRLTQVVLEKRLLNGCSNGSSSRSWSVIDWLKYVSIASHILTRVVVCYCWQLPDKVTSQPVHSRSWQCHAASHCFSSYHIFSDNTQKPSSSYFRGSSDFWAGMVSVKIAWNGSRILIQKINCHLTNCELLRWLVKVPSRDICHYRMLNMSVDDVLYLQCRTVRMSHGHVTCKLAKLMSVMLTCGVLQQYL